MSISSMLGDIRNKSTSYPASHTMGPAIKYVVYRTTNQINGKYYFGKHNTIKVNDSYLGSGILLRAAIEKYGKDNFQKQNLRFCKTEEKAYLYEKERISAAFLDDKVNCYNIHPGGNGGTNRKIIKKGRKLTEEELDKYRRGQNNPCSSKNMSKEKRLAKGRKTRETLKQNKSMNGDKNPMSTKNYTKEKRRELAKRIGEIIKINGSCAGRKNKAFNTVYAFDKQTLLKVSISREVYKNDNHERYIHPASNEYKKYYKGR